MAETAPGWRRCSACKRPIDFATSFWVCSVSTCNRKRTGLAFCSVGCWEVHLPTANHREAWALERTAPTRAEAAAQARGESPPRPPRRVLVRDAESGKTQGPAARQLPIEILIVASRLRDYVRARSGMNTSDGVLEPLSEIVREVCDQAIRNAAAEGRKTLLERDVPKR